jgi:NAD-dependent deacetylase
MENLIQRAGKDLIAAKYAIALTGAGISTESGIPDFRGPSGIWTRNPQAERRAYQSYEEFLSDPKKWWEQRLQGPSLLGDLEKAKPNAGHYALVELETMGLLKCVITQNVDALHEKAGSGNVIEYHGSILKLRCVDCGSRFKRGEFDLETLRTEGALPPRCPKCGGTIKTDGVSFGEPIPNDVAQRSLKEAGKCDLMLICGTSAVVYPFADLPRIARQRKDGAPETIIIEVNADPTPLTEEKLSDYLIRGKTGEILPRLVETIRRSRER